MKKISKLNLKSLSKDSKKKIVGGSKTASGNCSPGETCVAAFDGYVIGYYKRN